MSILQNPALNKSTAFSQQEREQLGLTGLLPGTIETIELQHKRVLKQLGHKPTDYERYIYLMNLLDHNETLFYKTIMSDPAYFLPIIYDPTIGEACLKFDIGFRQPRGMYISIKQRGHIKEILKNWPENDVRFICVTDGGRILGLGDLGANGMGIPIGKLQLYTAAAGVLPKYLLPLFLDVGTNNESLLHDPLYLGIRETRPSQKELHAFVDEFVEAVQEVFPRCCIHFEDWTGSDAIDLLKRYREKVCCFNDDIQGTAAITLSGLINATKIKKQKLSQQKILFLGAGSAGIGIADLIVSVMVQEGLSLKDAQSRISLFDVKGLIESKRSDLMDYQKPYAHPNIPTKEFLEAIINPTGKQVTICLLHSCQIDPPPRPSLRPNLSMGSSSVGPLTLRSDGSSLTHFVTCLPVGLIRAAERIAKNIFDQKLSRVTRPDNIHELIQKNVYKPEYKKGVKQ